jgi:hypothetical protein
VTSSPTFKTVYEFTGHSTPISQTRSGHHSLIRNSAENGCTFRNGTRLCDTVNGIYSAEK